MRRQALAAEPTRPFARTAGGLDGHLVSLLAPFSFEAEQYRVLRHMIEQAHREAGLRVFGVTSPVMGDGKTTTAINLAAAVAQAAQLRVLLVDVDLRRGSVRHHLGFGDAAGPGLSDAILDVERPLADVVRRCPSSDLSVVTAGRCPDAPYELLKSSRLGELITEARESYDYVILDTPPLVLVPDCRVIEKWVDGFVMVVAAHKTPRKLVEEAVEVMDPAKLLGLVFNGDDRPLGGYSGYYGYYGYGHSANGHRHSLWRRAVARVAGRVR